MLRVLELNLIGEPVPKGRPRLTSFGGHARAYTPAKTRNSENDLRAQIHAQLPKDWTVSTSPLHVKVIFTLTRPKTEPTRLFPHKKPDIDNLLKTLFDACNSVIFNDDAQIVMLNAAKVYGQPGIYISVIEMTEKAPKSITLR